MNLLIKGRYSSFGSQVIKSHKRIQLMQNNLHFIWRPFDKNQTLNSKRHSHSTAIIIMSQIAPMAGLLVGRYIQRRWPYLRYMDNKIIKNWLFDNKYKLISVVGLIGGATSAVIHRFSEETPLTKRKRFVIFSKEDYEPISDLLYKMFINAYKDRILAADHSITERVHRIARRLLDSNKEFEEIANKNWSVYVIRSSHTSNAFVLPTGQIFVYSGIVKDCDNDDQLAAILAHELSHTLLVHGKEMMSQEVCVNALISCAVLLLWIRFPPIKAMVGILGSSLAVRSLFVLPKQRSIEFEADFVGLALMAKACYDVREGSAFWMKMSANENTKRLDFLSTHPTSVSRYELMDTYMESMIKIRESYNCSQLSQTDPRLEMRRKLTEKEFMKLSRNLNDYKIYK